MIDPNQMKQFFLRTLLLEGENYETILNSLKAYHQSNRTKDDHYLIVDTLKKEITKTAKELLSDTQLNAFIEESLKQLKHA